MAEDIIKHVFRPGSAVILVFFDPKRQYPIPVPVSLGAKYTGLEKIAIFD